MNEVLEVQGEVTCSKLDKKSEELYRTWISRLEGTLGEQKSITSAKAHKENTKAITFLKSVVLLFTSAPALSMADRLLGVPPGNRKAL